jgi:hypothetical protein
MSAQNVSVSIDESHWTRIGEVVQRVRRAGLKVDQQLDSIGVITGSIDPAKIARLRRVEGVTAVEPELTFQLPDPNSPIQ